MKIIIIGAVRRKLSDRLCEQSRFRGSGFIPLMQPMSQPVASMIRMFFDTTRIKYENKARNRNRLSI